MFVVVCAYPAVLLSMTNPPAVPDTDFIHAGPTVATIALGAPVPEVGVALSATMTTPYSLALAEVPFAIAPEALVLTRLPSSTASEVLTASLRVELKVRVS